jgi:hypothetical protein
MKTGIKQILIVALLILSCSAFLTACGGDAPAATTPVADASLPNGAQVIVPPTITPIPTPTPERVGLAPVKHQTGVSFRKGNPASLNQIQADLLLTEEALTGSAPGGSSGGGGGGGGPTSAPGQPVNPTPGSTSAPGQPINPSPAPAGNWTYTVGSWKVSPNTNDIFLDTDSTGQYLIVAIIVQNTGTKSVAFSGVGLQVQFGTAGTSSYSDSVAQAYVKANSSPGGTFATPIAANSAKIVYGAFRRPANENGVFILKSTSPSGLRVPLNS